MNHSAVIEEKQDLYEKCKTRSNRDLEEECISHMKDRGFLFTGPFDITGTLVKFAGRDGSKKKTEWYKANGQISPDGKFSLHVTYNSHHNSLNSDENYVFNSKSSKLLDENELKTQRECVEKMQRERADAAAQKEKTRRAKALIARERFNKASENGQSTYLTRKCVGAHGLRFENIGNETVTLVPMRDENGEIQALQEIYETKRIFWNKIKPRDKNYTNDVKGLFHVIGKIIDGQLIRVSEGYATSASCYQSTECVYPHVVAFSAGAYKTIIPILRKLYPNSSISICADNNVRDNPEEENTGVKEAERAAKKTTGCSVTYPIFHEGKERDEGGNRYADFNDLMIVEGKEEVRMQIENAEEDAFLEEEKKEKQKGEKHPWDIVEIPYGYVLNDKGVWKASNISKKKKNSDEEEEQETTTTKICDPIWVSGRFRDYVGSNSGLFLQWIDLDGNQREMCIERRKLHAEGKLIAQELAHNNLAIVPDKEKELTKYLSAFKTQKTYRSVKSLGWLENPVGDLLYVTKQHTFRKHNTNLQEDIIFQQDTNSGTPSPLECKGTLTEWKENIGRPCRGNSVPIFLQSFALAGTIIKYADTGSVGVHLSGFTSRGKTTAAQTSASTTGCAADPTWAPKISIIKRWLATANALEGLAAQATDNVLVLDEIGQCPGSDLDKVIYNLFGGRGKERFTQQALQKATRDWCTVVISTGERTLQERLAETNSKTPPGLFVRFIDIHVDEVFTDYHGEGQKTFVDKLKANCGLFYGTPATAFIQKIISTYKNSQDLRESISNGCASLVKEISGGALLSQEHSRVLKLFCLAALTGIWASEWEVFPYTREQILASARALFAKWHDDNQKQTDDIRCICAVRDYYLKKQDSAFRPCDLQENDMRRFDIYGYTTGLGKFYLTKEGLDQALKGLSKKIALKSLLIKGYLLREESSTRNDSKKTIDGIKGALRVFVISEKICEFDEDSA